MTFFSRAFTAGLAALALASAAPAPAGINHGGGGGGGDPALPGYTQIHLPTLASSWTGTIGMDTGYPIDNGASGIDIQDSFAGGRHMAYYDFSPGATEIQQFVVTLTPKNSGQYAQVALYNNATFKVQSVVVDVNACTWQETHQAGSPTNTGFQVDLLANGRCRVSVWQDMNGGSGSEVYVAISDSAHPTYTSDAPSFVGNGTHTITVFPSGT